jgi:hypothetical protein
MARMEGALAAHHNLKFLICFDRVGKFQAELHSAFESLSINLRTLEGCEMKYFLVA